MPSGLWVGALAESAQPIQGRHLPSSSEVLSKSPPSSTGEGTRSALGGCHPDRRGFLCPIPTPSPAPWPDTLRALIVRGQSLLLPPLWADVISSNSLRSREESRCSKDDRDCLGWKEYTTEQCLGVNVRGEGELIVALIGVTVIEQPKAIS